jgi:hypothetical protein
LKKERYCTGGCGKRQRTGYLSSPDTERLQDEELARLGKENKILREAV